MSTPRQFAASDGSVWEVDVVPVMGRVEGGSRIPMIGETPFHMHFTRIDPPGDSRIRLLSPEMGLRSLDLTDDELRAMLEEGK